MKELRIAGIFLKVFAEGEYEIVDGAGRWIDIIAPYILQDMLARYHAVFAVYEELEQGDLLFGEFIFCAAGAFGLIGHKVHLIITEFECLQVLFILGAFHAMFDQDLDA